MVFYHKRKRALNIFNDRFCVCGLTFVHINVLAYLEKALHSELRACSLFIKNHHFSAMLPRKLQLMEAAMHKCLLVKKWPYRNSFAKVTWSVTELMEGTFSILHFTLYQTKNDCCHAHFSLSSKLSVNRLLQVHKSGLQCQGIGCR